MRGEEGCGKGERERDAFYEVCFIGQFVAEPGTGPLLCRTHDCDGT